MKLVLGLITTIIIAITAKAQSFEIEDYSRFHSDNRGVWYVDNSSITYRGQTRFLWTALNSSENGVVMFMSTELNCRSKKIRIWKTIARNVAAGTTTTIGRRSPWMGQDDISNALVKDLCN